MHLLSRLALIATAAAVLSAHGGHAFAGSNSDTATGLIAGLGLSAASGKTSLSSGAGSIEGGLLGSDAIQEAGKIIAALVNGQVGAGAKVLILAHDEKVDLISPVLVKSRIDKVAAQVGALKCKPAAPAPAPGPPNPHLFGGILGKFDKSGLSTVLPSDLVGTALIDTAISPVPLSADDRMLVDAIIMNRTQPQLRPNGQFAKPTYAGAAVSGPSYFLASEAVALPGAGGVQASYDKLLAAIDEKRTPCANSEDKGAVDAASTFAAALSSPGDKGALSTLAAAIQYEAFADATILRVAVEQYGGTTVTRTGIIYSLGLGTPATVSAGLLVSFRLIDPKLGAIKELGFVRCGIAPANLRKVEANLATTADVVCAYRASA